MPLGERFFTVAGFKYYIPRTSFVLTKKTNNILNACTTPFVISVCIRAKIYRRKLQRKRKGEHY